MSKINDMLGAVGVCIGWLTKALLFIPIVLYAAIIIISRGHPNV
jgi:hypothetical protein